MPTTTLSRNTARLLTGVCLALALTGWNPVVAAPMTFEMFQQMVGWTSRVVHADCIDLSDGTNCIRFFPGRRRTEINGRAVWLHAIAEPAGDQFITLDARDAREVLLPLLQPVPQEQRLLRIMLDAGHGGEDGGAVSARPPLIEKELVLDLSLRIGRRLECAGMIVGYTRATDTFLSLDARTAAARVWRADAFVSLHANFAANRHALGPETFVLPLAGYATTGNDSRLSYRPRAGNSNDVYNTLLGYSIHRRLPGKNDEADRGLRRARYQVLRQASCPAALIEVGFLSHATEARLLASGWFRDQLACAVADGIIEYSQRLSTQSSVNSSNTACITTNKPVACLKEDQAARDQQSTVSRKR